MVYIVKYVIFGVGWIIVVGCVICIIYKLAFVFYGCRFGVKYLDMCRFCYWIGSIYNGNIIIKVCGNVSLVVGVV